MSEPLSFTDATPRFSLPMLFAGQSQKEVFVNEANARIDALLHPSIEGEAASPPPNPARGECWLIGSNAAGEWAGHEGKLAAFLESGWAIIEPNIGMSVFDKQAAACRRYDGNWVIGLAPTAPQGGATIDSEARSALEGLIQTLISAGYLMQSSN